MVVESGPIHAGRHATLLTIRTPPVPARHRVQNTWMPLGPPPAGRRNEAPGQENRLDAIEVETGVDPRHVVIWLHGLGADGSDFVPIVPELGLADAQGRVPSIRFVFPNAPSMPVTVNGGYVMPAWYDILGTDLERREDEAGLRRSQQAITALVQAEHARGIAYERIVLAGFSQGCAISLLTGIRLPHRLAGIIGLSGYLPLAATTAAERHDANADTPIFLAHGRLDPVVPFTRGVASRDALIALGHRVSWHEYPIEHTVSIDEVRDIGGFLRGVCAG